MHRIILAGLMFTLVGCGSNEPSNAEIARGMETTFARESGASPSQLKATANKSGNGRWDVRMNIRKGNEQHTLNATAIQDKNGDIHYFTD